MEIRSLAELLEGSLEEDSIYFPSVLREKILQLFDHEDHEAAFALILSLVQTDRFIPNAAIYARLLLEMEQAEDPNVRLSAYCTLKQLQCSCNVELKESVWRPKTEHHWVYLCNLFDELIKLETNLKNGVTNPPEEDAYMYEDDKKRKRRQEKLAETPPPKRTRRKTKKEQQEEAFQKKVAETTEEKKKVSEEKKMTIRLENTQYVLKYLLGIFQENLKNRPRLKFNFLNQLISCKTKGETTYGGEPGERLRKLFGLLFQVFACGGRVSCSLVICLFEQVWKSVSEAIFEENLPVIFSEFKSLTEEKKREFLESLYNNEFRLRLVTYILTDMASKKLVKDAKKWEQQPGLSIEKIVNYYLVLLPQGDGKKGASGVNREKSEESHCLLVSFLIQSYVVGFADHLLKHPLEYQTLQNEVDKWVGRRKRKARDNALAAYLHRATSSFHLLQS